MKNEVIIKDLLNNEMKFTDEQKDLLAFLPKTLKNSQELTDSAKLVLGNIIFLYGMEDAQKNGYIYRTNSKMMEEINIKSEHTLIGAVRLLELLGYIETKRGKRNEASTYKLLKNCSKKCSNNCSNKQENCSNEIETLQNEVLLLQKQVVLLQKEIENLKNCSKKCSTDTDIDEDKEKINEQYTRNINDSRRIVTEDKEKINKKESCYGDSLQSGTTEDNTINVFNNSSSGVGDSPLAETPEDSVKVFSNIPSGDGESSQSSTVGNEDITSSGVEEENNPQSESSNNGAGRTLTHQVEQETTPHEKMQENAPQTAKNASFEKMTTSTQGNVITSNSGNGEHKVQSGKVISNCSIFTENCPKPYLTPQIPLTPLSSPNKATGDVQATKVEQLPTNDIKTRQNAQECPQIEFDEKWYNDTYALMDYFKTLEDLDELYNRLKQCKNKRMIMDFKYKVWHSYDLNDSNLQNRAMQIVTELTRMRA